VNGPARVHSELAVLLDIVLASPNALFSGFATFYVGPCSRDGMNMTWQILLGPNRARYFLWTGQEISAAEAKVLDVINEVVPRDQLLDRAHELARLLLKQPKLVRKHSRQMLMQNIKRAHAWRGAAGEHARNFGLGLLRPGHLAGRLAEGPSATFRSHP